MPPIVFSNLIDIKRISATKERSHCALMVHAQSQQSMIANTSKKGLFTFEMADTLDAPSSGSTLHTKEVPESHQHPLATGEVDLKLEKIFLLDSTTTAEDLHKSLQRHDLSGRPLLQDPQQVPSMSETQQSQAMFAGPKDY